MLSSPTARFSCMTLACQRKTTPHSSTSSRITSLSPRKSSGRTNDRSSAIRCVRPRTSSIAVAHASQVGVTLENTEKPKCAVHEPCLNVIARLDPSERPLDVMQHSPDPKCRFFWKMSEKPPYETQFPGLNAPNVVPQAENINQRWTPIMEKWGQSMKNA